MSAAGETQRVRTSTEPHRELGWTWYVTLLAGPWETEVAAKGNAPTQALAAQRAFRAYETLTADYPGHYELEGTS